MILLERRTPKSILLHKALLKRLDPRDKDYTYIQDSLQLLEAGYDGETHVDREWMEMPYLNEHFLLFNYETENEFGFSHQMDTLLLTKHFVLVLDVKNISGRVDYDFEKHQFVRTKPNGEKKIFSNPYDQIYRHGELLERLLVKAKCSLPIEKLIVMSSTSTFIGNVPKYPPTIHASGLRTFAKRFMSQHPCVLTNSQLDKLGKFFMERLISRKFDLNISLNRIRKGALCEKCNYQSAMKYQDGLWTCPRCGFSSKKVLLEGLHDYRLLIDEKITNREFREFFGVGSSDTAQKILSRLNLKAEGKNRGRYYIIPENILDTIS